MPSSPRCCSWRLLAVVLLLLLAASSSTLVAAASNSPPKAGAAHAIAAVARKAAPPTPSRRMGKTKRNAQKPLQQAHRKDYSLFLCPNRVAACPVSAPGSTRAAVKKTDLKVLGDWFKAGFECIDTRTEMASCGGCVSLGEGQDCTSIPHASEIGCEKGVCIVYECNPGFLLSKDGQHCVKKVAAK